MRIGVSPGEIDLADRGFTDLNPVLCGDEACPPGHNVGPGARSCYLLHYIVSGRGTLENPRGSFEVGAGKCFLIRPDELTVYRADDADPWYYGNTAQFAADALSTHLLASFPSYVTKILDVGPTTPANFCLV